MTNNPTTFDLLPVFPYRRLLTGGPIMGGPDWPGFEHRSWERHWRFEKVVDVEINKSEYESEPFQYLAGTWLYAGAIVEQFGHQMSEFMHRLPVSRPINFDGVLFSNQLSRKSSTIPSYVQECANYVIGHNVPIHLVKQPTLIQNLVVYPQLSHWGSDARADYLEGLWKLQNQHFRNSPSGPAFITRSSLRAGKLAGETYIGSLLQSAGFTVVDPSQIPWYQQVKLYATSPLLVFTEGSAVHGAEHLGRLSTTVMLARRRGLMSVRLARVLEQRSSIFRVCDAISSLLDCKYQVDTNETFLETPKSLTLINFEKVRDTFLEVGCGGALDKFDASEFRVAVQADIVSYLESFYVQRNTDPQEREILRRRFGHVATEYFKSMGY